MINLTSIVQNWNINWLHVATNFLFECLRLMKWMVRSSQVLMYMYALMHCNYTSHFLMTKFMTNTCIKQKKTISLTLYINNIYLQTQAYITISCKLYIIYNSLRRNTCSPWKWIKAALHKFCINLLCLNKVLEFSCNNNYLWGCCALCQLQDP